MIFLYQANFIFRLVLSNFVGNICPMTTKENTNEIDSKTFQRIRSIFNSALSSSLKFDRIKPYIKKKNDCLNHDARGDAFCL